AWMGMASEIWGHSVTGDAETIVTTVGNIANKLGNTKVGGELAEQLDRIKRAARSIKEKPIKPWSDADADVGPVDVNDLVRGRVLSLKKKEKYSALVPPPDAKGSNIVRIHRQCLQSVLDLLIDNAVEAIQSVGEPQIRVTCKEGSGNVLI